MEEIAEVYSRSLFDVAKEQGDLDRIHDELGEFADALADEPRPAGLLLLALLLLAGEEGRASSKLVEDADENFVRFLELLAERHRHAGRCSGSGARSTTCGARRTSCLPVTVTSAVELDQEMVDDIGKRIEEQTGQRIELSSKVDPDVLGGLVLQVGNMVLDASVRNRLEKLRKSVARAA